MPKLKPCSQEGAKYLPTKLNSKQSRKPTRGPDLLRGPSAWQAAELLSRIDHYQRLAQEVDEHYEGKLFVGKGKQAIKQAMKRCADYMQAQHEIFEHLREDVNELMFRMLMRDDILLLTKMQTAGAQARIVEATRSTIQSGKQAGNGVPTADGSAADVILERIMSTFLAKVKAGGVKFKGTPETDKQTTAGDLE